MKGGAPTQEPVDIDIVIDTSEAITHLLHCTFDPSAEGGDAGQFFNFIASGDANPSYQNPSDLAYEATSTDAALDTIGNSQQFQAGLSQSLPGHISGYVALQTTNITERL